MQTDTANPKHYKIEARFYVDPTWGPVCERKLGPTAGADNVIERVTDEHIRMHPSEFAKFQSSRASVAPVGLSLKRALGMEDDLIRLFNTHGVMDVETLAAVEDYRIPIMIPGNPEFGLELRDRARMMVPEARRTPLAPLAAPVGPSSREASVQEIEALKAKLAQAEREKADAYAMLELSTPPIGDVYEPEDLTGEGEAEAEAEGSHVRRGPGRPRRQQVA